MSIYFIDGLYEKNLDSLSINGNELSYKHNIDDIIYTIDDMALPHSMDSTHSPKPTTLTTFITRNGWTFWWDINIVHNAEIQFRKSKAELLF